jgi:hypothetical protein
MTIEYKDSKRIVLDTSATYTGDYSTQTGWTSNNSRISITGGYAYMNNSGSSYGDYIYTPLGLTLSDTAWVADFEYYNIGAINFYPFVLAAGTSLVGDNSVNQDFIAMSESNPNMLQLKYKDGSSNIVSSSTSNTMSTSTSYYCRLIRDGSNLSLKIYTDSARTSQFGSTLTLTISGTVSGLTTLHHSGLDIGGGTSGYYFKVRGTKIYNGVTSAPAKPTNVQDNSILVEKDTAKRFWFDAESSETLSQETESGTGELFNDVEIVAQKFTSGSSKIGKKVSSVAFYLKRNTSTIGSTNLQCFVGAGNQSSAVAYGTLPATSLTTSYAWYTFTPSVAGTERTLVADDRIMIRWADGSTTSDAPRMASDQSGNNPLANETGQYSSNDGSSFTDRSFDYMYKIISTTPATWTKDRQVTSGSAMTAGGGTSSATTNAQTSSNYVWTNIASISTARLYTFGTGNASNFTIGGANSVENSETWNGSSWATAISTDTQRRDTTATAGSYNDMIVAYGRNNAGTLLNSSSTFNGTTWSAGVTANTAREHPCGAGQSDSMLIAGGYESSGTSNKVDSYNGTTFTTETVLPTASYGQNMGASASNSAHIAGGATAMSGTYDGTTWTNTTELSVSTTHYFAGGGGDRDEHLVMGGYISSGTNYDTTWLWNGTSWVSKNALTTAKRAGAGDCTAR